MTISRLDRARAKMVALQEKIARLEEKSRRLDNDLVRRRENKSKRIPINPEIRAARIDGISEYIKSGDTYAAIARRLGLSRQRIHAIAKRHALGGGRKSAASLDNAG